MSDLYLSRIALRRDASIAAVAPLLLAGDATGHRGVWSAYATTPDASRDFLFRETGPGQYLALAPRPAPGGLLYEVESRPWAPELVPGLRAAFVLRAHATVNQAPAAHGQRGQRLSLQQWLLRRDGRVDRDVLGREAQAWLQRQLGEAATVEFATVVTSGKAEHKGRAGAARFDVMDLTGVLVVRDGAALRERIAAGIGRGRAFGCGLLLLRRP